MHAIAVHEPGGLDRLQLLDLPDPEPGAGEVRVRVHAAGVNLVDTMQREGYLDSGTRPLVMGNDFSGVVDRVGAGVVDVAVGDEVYGYKRFGNGTYAELTVVPAGWTARKPATLSHVEAAAFPCVALTAYQSVVDALAIAAGETLVVTGGAGGVGSIAVQLGTRRGARVIATASERNAAYLRVLGADGVVDYPATDWVDGVRALAPDGADALLETVGAETKRRAPEAVRDGGRLAWITGDPAPTLVRGITGADVHGMPRRETLDALTTLIDAGQLRLPVQRIFPLAEAAEAQRLVAAGHVRGKLVIEVVPG